MSPWPSVNIAPFLILSMGTFFVKHQSCLNKYKNILYRAIQQRVFSSFSLDIIEIELLRYINTDAHNLKRSDFTRYANLMRFELKLEVQPILAISCKFFYSCHYL